MRKRSVSSAQREGETGMREVIRRAQGPTGSAEVAKAMAAGSGQRNWLDDRLDEFSEWCAIALVALAGARGGLGGCLIDGC